MLFLHLVIESLNEFAGNNFFIGLSILAVGYVFYSRQKRSDRHSEFIKEITENTKGVIETVRKSTLILQRLQNTVMYFKDRNDNAGLKKFLEESLSEETKQIAHLSQDELMNKAVKLRASIEATEFENTVLLQEMAQMDVNLNEFLKEIKKLMASEFDKVPQIITGMNQKIEKIIDSSKKLVANIKKTA